MLRSALLSRAASQLQLLREQNRKMVKLLKRVGREGGVVAQLDAARRENKALLCKYTAVQVRAASGNDGMRVTGLFMGVRLAWWRSWTQTGRQAGRMEK